MCDLAQGSEEASPTKQIRAVALHSDAMAHIRDTAGDTTVTLPVLDVAQILSIAAAGPEGRGVDVAFTDVFASLLYELDALGEQARLDSGGGALVGAKGCAASGGIIAAAFLGAPLALLAPKVSALFARAAGLLAADAPTLGDGPLAFRAAAALDICLAAVPTIAEKALLERFEEEIQYVLSDPAVQQRLYDAPARVHQDSVVADLGAAAFFFSLAA